MPLRPEVYLVSYAHLLSSKSPLVQKEFCIKCSFELCQVALMEQGEADFEYSAECHSESTHT